MVHEQSVICPHGIASAGGNSLQLDQASSSSCASREMKIFAPEFYSLPGDMLEKMLLSTQLKDDIKKMKSVMPTFWESMCSLARTPRQIKHGKYKDHESKTEKKERNGKFGEKIEREEKKDEKHTNSLSGV
ncbi:hypothetical protein BDY19DRAFT_909240 [Irpex rosettiformis]|uniref:Uncharacterized protein n=1 Tax=Irpex rosettiformis TaxID=378272 RepID=A0ACB8TTA1_9APHY|nr:hypothetical protein BDY19DRAFT_909240 [Irpex rosettiformis]